MNISTHIWLLSLSPNRAGQPLIKSGKRLHRKEEFIEYKELADFGYNSELLVRTKLEDDRLKATFQVFPDNNPMPINLRFRIGKFQDVKVLSERETFAEFDSKYKEGGRYKIYISLHKEA